jgi:hypothetical protein
LAILHKTFGTRLATRYRRKSFGSKALRRAAAPRSLSCYAARVYVD